jgi:hypothetical protein
MWTARVAAIALGALVAGGPASACVDDSDCDDCNVCTVNDACDPVLGCTTTPVPGCVPCGLAADCADGNPCTDDVCDCGACLNPPLPNGTSCSDGLLCNGFEACLGGVCRPGTYPCLTDVNPCTYDFCSEETMACENMPLTGTSCDDGDACTTVDACANGVCTGGVSITVCTDGDGCCPEGCQGVQDHDCPQGVGDQSFEPTDCTTSSMARRVSEFEPLAQTFTPTQPSLIGVEVYLHFQGIPEWDTMTVNIRDGSIAGPILASATSFVAESGALGAAFHRFDLPAPLSLTVGHVYALELDGNNYSAFWRGCNANGYSGGMSIQSGAPVSGQDLFFRTVAAEPIPHLSASGSVILAVLLPFVVECMRRRREKRARTP